MEELQKKMKTLKTLKPETRTKKAEQILDLAIKDSQKYINEFGIIDVDTMSVDQAYSLINTDFGTLGLLTF
jgi:hypothetical protein